MNWTLTVPYQTRIKMLKEENMGHDFRGGNRCKWCGANSYLAGEECSGDSSGYEDYLYEQYRDQELLG